MNLGASYGSVAVDGMTFIRPVKIGDAVVTKVSIAALDVTKSHVTIAFECSVAGRTVMDGEALVIVPRRRRARASV